MRMCRACYSCTIQSNCTCNLLPSCEVDDLDLIFVSLCYVEDCLLSQVFISTSRFMEDGGLPHLLDCIYNWKQNCLNNFGFDMMH